MIAATLLPSAGPIAERPAEMLVLVGALALLPAALVTLTSFLKISVVLSIARSALGAPQVPPSTVVTGLALVLTFFEGLGGMALATAWYGAWDLLSGGVLAYWWARRPPT